MSRRVVLELPDLLKPVAGKTRFEVSATSVAEVLNQTVEQVPALGHHLLDDAGGLRPHILCLLNGENLDRSCLGEIPVADGDHVLIHQAISGG